MKLTMVYANGIRRTEICVNILSSDQGLKLILTEICAKYGSSREGL